MNVRSLIIAQSISLLSTEASNQKPRVDHMNLIYAKEKSAVSFIKYNINSNIIKYF